MSHKQPNLTKEATNANLAPSAAPCTTTRWMPTRRGICCIFYVALCMWLLAAHPPHADASVEVRTLEAAPIDSMRQQLRQYRQRARRQLDQPPGQGQYIMVRNAPRPAFNASGRAAPSFKFAFFSDTHYWMPTNARRTWEMRSDGATVRDGLIVSDSEAVLAQAAPRHPNLPAPEIGQTWAKITQEHTASTRKIVELRL